MSAAKSGSSLRTLVLTPERIPNFLIPPRSPFPLSSPRSLRKSTDRTRPLSGYGDDSLAASPAEAASPGFRPRRLPSRTKTPECVDTDLTTRAAMSLQHVEKVTTPYGFRAVLAASPCTRRRESLFHRTKWDKTVRNSADPEPGPAASRDRSLGSATSPAAAIMVHGPGTRRTETH